MRTMITLILALFTTSVLANAEGNWNGWVYWRFQGQGPKCSATMKIRETPSEFKRLGGVVDCDIVVMDMQEEIFTKANGKLLKDGEEIGSYQDNFYAWKERYNEDTFVHSRIQLKGNSMDYQERWIQISDGREIYAIDGRMFRP